MHEKNGKVLNPKYTVIEKLQQKIPILLISVLVVSVGLYSYANLTTSGLWLDELASVFFSESTYSLTYLFQTRMIQDTSPPLYYILLHYWMLAFGEDEYSVRLLGWLFAVMAMLATYGFARKMYDRGVAFVLAAALFCSPGLVEYGLDARAYVLLLLLSSVLLLQAILLCNQITGGDTPNRIDVLVFAIVGLLASLTHYSGLFLYAILGVYLYVLALIRREGDSRILLYGVSSIVVYTLWILATIPGIKHRLGAGSGPGFSNNLLENLYEGFVIGFGSIYVVGILIAPVAYACLRYGKSYCTRHDFILPVLGVAGVIAIYWAISLHTVIQTPRNYLVLLPPILTLTVCAAARILSGKSFLWGAMCVCVLFALMSIGRISEIKSEMREAGKFISVQSGCESGLIYVIPDMGRGTHHFRYHLPSESLQLITDRQGPFDLTDKALLSQECRVALWIMRWTDRDDDLIRHFGLSPEGLQGVHFKYATVYLRK